MDEWLGPNQADVAQMDPSEKISMKLDIHGTPAENLQRLITDCGVSPHKVCCLTLRYSFQVRWKRSLVTNEHSFRSLSWCTNSHPNPSPIELSTGSSQR